MSALIFGSILVFFSLCLLKGLNTLPYQPITAKNFSIIIAVKDESDNLLSLLLSLLGLDYFSGAYEVIFIDDHSTDDSFRTLSKYCAKVDGYSVYQLPEGQNGKKAALELGIQKASYGWIALTDADCIVHPEWLKMINTHIQNNEQVSMFVGYSPESFVSSFQYFRQLAAANIYAAGIYSGFPFSCSGRNLIFHRDSFEEVGGYEGFHHLSSGDDKILLRKFTTTKKVISYIPYPPVFTKPVEGKNIREQNLRRFGKVSMSTLSWQVFMGLIGLLLIAMPVEFVLWHRLSVWLSMLVIYIFSTNLMVLLGCVLHREKIRPLYPLFALIFPYYLLYQMSVSFHKKWKWR